MSLPEEILYVRRSFSHELPHTAPSMSEMMGVCFHDLLDQLTELKNQDQDSPSEILEKTEKKHHC